MKLIHRKSKSTIKVDQCCRLGLIIIDQASSDYTTYFT